MLEDPKVTAVSILATLYDFLDRIVSNELNTLEVVRQEAILVRKRIAEAEIDSDADLIGHKDESLAEQVSQARAQILSSLIPGIVVHDLSSALFRIRHQSKICLGTWRNFERDYVPPDCVKPLGDDILRVGEAVDYAFKVLVPIRNLTANNSIEEFSVEELLERITGIITPRLSVNGIQIDTSQAVNSTLRGAGNMRSDIGLLCLAFLNIVSFIVKHIMASHEPSNHGDAAEPSTKRRNNRKLILIRPTQLDLPQGCVGWDFISSAPAISEALGKRAFMRGFDVHANGQGTELFLARKIAEYCGGFLDFHRASVNPRQAQGELGLTLWVEMRIDTRESIHDL